MYNISTVGNNNGSIPTENRKNTKTQRKKWSKQQWEHTTNLISITIIIRQDEGKISRKLVECINTYLLKDGPNLGCKSLEIHESVQQFAFRCWFSTHDRSLKDALVCCAKLQKI
ncbi:hypothetical protein ACS0TY_003570 [Phlomoides rotata]